jgi:hypothetical protein
LWALDKIFLVPMLNSLGIYYIETFKKWDFYFRALGSLVVLSFSQLLSFYSVLSKPLSETLSSAGTAVCLTGQ